MTMKLKTEMIDGKKYEISVTDRGTFGTKYQDEWLEKPTLKLLIEKLRELLRTENRVAVPATLLSDHWHREKMELTDIELIGIHGGNQNVLYRGVGKGKQPTEQMR